MKICSEIKFKVARLHILKEQSHKKTNTFFIELLL